MDISNGSAMRCEVLESCGTEENGIGSDLLDKPILAARARHPNRHQDFAKKPNRMLEMKDEGMGWSSIGSCSWKLALEA